MDQETLNKANVLQRDIMEVEGQIKAANSLLEQLKQEEVPDGVLILGSYKEEIDITSELGHELLSKVKKSYTKHLGNLYAEFEAL